MYQDNIVLCGASSYEQKYYFNQDFASLPETVKQELQIMCVLFTEDIGGVLILEFTPEGSLEFRVEAEENDYLFDEIVTNMPVRGKMTKEELDRLYARFFDKATEILKKNAVIVMYTQETGFVKKQLRLHREYMLLQEYCMQEKTGFSLLIIGVRG